METKGHGCPQIGVIQTRSVAEEQVCERCPIDQTQMYEPAAIL